VPGAVPGLPGLAAFAGIKFGGYVLAGLALRKVQPAIHASAVKMAATRTALGILVGPPLMLAAIYAMETLLPNSHSAAPAVLLYAYLFTVRLLVWALVIFLFTKNLGMPRSQSWRYAGVGAVWSCLLDLPGFGLALVAPGQITIC
jgi:hypothetical protein